MLDATILQNFLKNSGLKYRTGAVSYIFTCPLCNKKDKLYIRKRDGVFICFHCKETERFYGKCQFALAKLLNISVKEIENQLFGGDNYKFTELIKIRFNNAIFNDYINENLKEEDFVENDELTEVMWHPEFVELDSIMGEDGLNYLNSRGVNLELAKKYQLKYQPSSHRVIFPVIVNGTLLGWQGRLVFENQDDYIKEDGKFKYFNPKILSSKGLSGGKYLMFQDNLSNSEHAILTEGPFDAIKLDKVGGNIAAMGKGISVKKLQTIINYGVKKVYIGLDPDAPEAVDFACKELLRLNPDLELYHLIPPEGKDDLGECSVEEATEQFLKAERIGFPKLFIYLRNKYAM